MNENESSAKPRFLARLGSGLLGPLRAIGGFILRHKILSVLVLAVLVGGGLLLRGFLAAKTTAGQAATYSFIRTTTLARGTLDDTVSTTGTVQSADTSSVTYNAATGGAGSAKVKTVNVAVGDSVAAGDVIVTLDTSDIEESITKAKESLADQVDKAQSTYNDALDSYNQAVADYNTQAATTTSLETDLNAARIALAAAKNTITAFQSAYDEAYSTLQNDTTALNAAKNAEAAAKAAVDAAKAALAAADSSASDYQSYVDAAAQAGSEATAASATVEEKQNAYDTAQSKFAEAEKALNDAKASSGYTTLAQAESAADTKYEQAKSQLEQLETQVTNTKKTLDNAADALADAGTSDTLEDLYDQLEACSLTAETSGKVTALNVSVGDTPSGTIATIQDTGSLKIAITIAEADINSVSQGMTCRITSDATDATIGGTLTQIDPVAGQSGTFGAEVTVTDQNTDLLVGMNATVEIILSSTSDCFTVPIDAVGTDDTGSFVYRQTGGSGTSMTFEQVYVTTGDSNDYYIEISADALAEGDVIRSSADMTQGAEETTEADSANLMFSMGGGNMTGGNMNGGNMGGERPTGTRPSGGQ